jgi:hypothetical protein
MGRALRTRPEVQALRMTSIGVLHDLTRPKPPPEPPQGAAPYNHAYSENCSTQTVAQHTPIWLTSLPKAQPTHCPSDRGTWRAYLSRCRRLPRSKHQTCLRLLHRDLGRRFQKDSHLSWRHHSRRSAKFSGENTALRVTAGLTLRQSTYM